MHAVPPQRLDLRICQQTRIVRSSIASATASVIRENLSACGFSGRRIDRPAPIEIMLQKDPLIGLEMAQYPLGFAFELIHQPWIKSGAIPDVDRVQRRASGR
jgi:hypothetical protein